MSSLAVELRGITKSFFSTVANKNINLGIVKGEVHAVVGENGAGKSTLMKILCGLFKPDKGKIFINGRRANIENPASSIEFGLGMIHQNFMLIDEFTVAENIILGTTYMPQILPYYMKNQKYYYIRMIGDRELNIFNQIRREQKEAIQNLDENIQNLKNIPNIYEIFIIVNNHFQGFAPESVNNLKKKFGLEYHSFNNQKRLTDFIS